ncbi:hypothetical protein HS041_29590 [Planomonospora sp. ID67723]|uniref:hypothetical protein n=1 Tax=Planomonospora sp. ID67723 TaxID=2738134 RepID=UPI0018C392E2|nr:hypothetical protein [Planomonospora sp. ID67723]MBG0831867.1 hypothetical protein [Planomonospora sp. ID67723]
MKDTTHPSLTSPFTPSAPGAVPARPVRPGGGLSIAVVVLLGATTLVDLAALVITVDHPQTKETGEDTRTVDPTGEAHPPPAPNPATYQASSRTVRRESRRGIHPTGGSKPVTPTRAVNPGD